MPALINHMPIAGCFHDRRITLLVKHQLPQMPAKRIYGLALGFEDLNDHEPLRSDPLLAVLSGKTGVGRAAGGQKHAAPAGAGRAQRPLRQLWFSPFSNAFVLLPTLSLIGSTISAWYSISKVSTAGIDANMHIQIVATSSFT